MDSEHLEAYLADELDESARRQVERALRNDSDLRASYLAQLQMSSVLEALLAPEAEPDDVAAFEDSVMNSIRLEGLPEHREFAKSVLTEIVEEREGMTPIRWPDVIKTALLSAAATIALMAILQTIIFRDAGEGFASNPGGGGGTLQFSARLEQSDSARWSQATLGALREDGWLANGLMELEKGRAMIAFNSGASAIVEGPAVLSIESGNRVFLKSGRITANVPPLASGFTVNTPRLNAVDIGTRFGVSVDEGGNSELHVMEGEVEASRTSGNAVPVLVREGLAIRADSRTRSQLVPVPYGGDRFEQLIAPRETPVPGLFYSFDESGGAILDSSGSSQYHDVSIVGELDASPRRSAGKVGGGLVFRSGESLKVPLSRDFRVDEAHTIAFWVKMPPKIGQNFQENMIQYGREGGAWKVACNLSDNRGSRGALRVEFGEGYVTGSTDIADGNWHHIAYRFLGAHGSDLSSCVHLFVDGMPEPISDYRAGEIPSTRAGSIQFGDAGRGGLHGWIDEIALFQEAISTSAIHSFLD